MWFEDENDSLLEIEDLLTDEMTEKLSDEDLQPILSVAPSSSQKKKKTKKSTKKSSAKKKTTKKTKSKLFEIESHETPDEALGDDKKIEITEAQSSPELVSQIDEIPIKIEASTDNKTLKEITESWQELYRFSTEVNSNFKQLSEYMRQLAQSHVDAVQKLNAKKKGTDKKVSLFIVVTSTLALILSILSLSLVQSIRSEYYSNLYETSKSQKVFEKTKDRR